MGFEAVPWSVNPTEESNVAVREMKGLWLIADGGLVGADNPSPHGGTWAYRIVKDGEVIREAAGIVRPHEGPVSNNVSEMYAVIRGLEEFIDYHADLADEGSITLVSDSKVTLGRITGQWSKWAGMPESLRERALDLRWLIRKAYLVDGHPTAAQLAAESGSRGNLVSPHNKWCDESAKAAGVAKAIELGIATPKPEKVKKVKKGKKG